MRVTKLSGRNVKGCSFEHDLAPVTLFHGPNWAGKTARLDALALALAGYLPGVASKPNEVFDRVASGNPLGVSADLSNGKALTRLWSRNGKGAVSKEEATYGFEMPAVAMDPSEFLGLSARERVKFLFSRCKLPPELTTESASRALVVNVKNIRLDTNTPASEQAIADVAQALSFIGAPSSADGASGTTQAWVEGLVELVSDRKKAATANVQRLEKTMQGLTQTSSVGPTPPQDAEARLAKARADLEAASAELHKREAELRQCRQDWCEADAAAKSAPDTGALRAEVEAAEKALAEHKVPEQPKPVTSERLQRSERDLADAKARKESVKTALRQAEEELAELQKEAACPKCGQSLAKLRPKMVKAQKDLIKEHEFKLKEAVEDSEAAKKEQEAATAEWQDWVASQEEWSVRVRRRRELEAALNEANYKLSLSGSATAASQDATAKLPGLKAKGEALAKEVEALRTVEAEARAKVSEADVAYKRLLAVRAEAATRARAEAELAKGRAEAEVWKQAQKLVAELQAKLVEAAVGPLVNRANELCGGLLRAPLALVDGELVMDRQGFGPVTHKTFSGTERALAYAALSIALGSDAPIRLAVIDEVGRLDSGNRRMLVDALCGLVRTGKLDQAVLVDTESIIGPGGSCPGEYMEVRL